MADGDLNDDDIKKPAKEILFVQDDGFFTHSTGDTYEGGFEIKKKDRTAKMNGRGTYKTNEGDTYVGAWDNDRLGCGDEVTITYVDGSQYIGSFKEWSYVGTGKYIYPDNSKLDCEFSDNCPVSNLTLTDPNGHTWLGQAEQGFAWFHPVNHFYDMLEKPKQIVHQKGSKESKETAKTKSRAPSIIKSRK